MAKAIKKANFNSTLVRLEDAARNRYDFLQEFQFHTGTIRRIEELGGWPAIGVFQFHTGTIRRLRT